jgi:hypothetical protein
VVFTSKNVQLGWRGTLTARATDSLGGTTLSAPINVSVIGPQLTISSPQNGATLIGNTVLVRGNITAPPNSGVAVNGQVAAIDDNGNYFANVPLSAGSNTITATLTTADSYTTNQSVAVSSDGSTPFLAVSADALEGLAPLQVNFTVTNNSTTTATVQVNGGSAFTVPAGAALGETVTATGAQSVTFTFTATDGSGNRATVSEVIVAHDPTKMDQKLGAIWNGMNTALIAGDKATALKGLSGFAQSKYGPVFDVLMPNYAAIAASFSVP